LGGKDLINFQHKALISKGKEGQQNNMKRKKNKDKVKLGICSYEFGRRIENGLFPGSHLSSCSFKWILFTMKLNYLMPPKKKKEKRKKKRKILCHPRG
jgi:hypothetical protein